LHLILIYLKTVCFLNLQSKLPLTAFVNMFFASCLFLLNFVFHFCKDNWQLSLKVISYFAKSFCRKRVLIQTYALLLLCCLEFIFLDFVNLFIAFLYAKLLIYPSEAMQLTWYSFILTFSIIFVAAIRISHKKLSLVEIPTITLAFYYFIILK